jgi:hypothetical protein
MVCLILKLHAALLESEQLYLKAFTITEVCVDTVKLLSAVLRACEENAHTNQRAIVVYVAFGGKNIISDSALVSSNSFYKTNKNSRSTKRKKKPYLSISYAFLSLFLVNQYGTPAPACSS